MTVREPFIHPIYMRHITAAHVNVHTSRELTTIDVGAPDGPTIRIWVEGGTTVDRLLTVKEIGMEIIEQALSHLDEIEDRAANPTPERIVVADEHALAYADDVEFEGGAF